MNHGDGQSNVGMGSSPEGCHAQGKGQQDGDLKESQETAGAAQAGSHGLTLR